MNLGARPGRFWVTLKEVVYKVGTVNDAARALVVRPNSLNKGGHRPRAFSAGRGGSDAMRRSELML